MVTTPRPPRGRRWRARSSRRCGRTAGTPPSTRRARRPRPARDLVDVGHEVAVRQHHALGQPRRPRGIGQDDDVLVEVDGHLRRHAARPTGRRRGSAPSASPTTASVRTPVSSIPSRATRQELRHRDEKRRGRGHELVVELRAPCRLGFTVVTVPPAQATAWKAMQNSGMLGSMSATVAPLPKPRAVSPPASALTSAMKARPSSPAPVGPSTRTGRSSRGTPSKTRSVTTARSARARPAGSCR
jgi:hypothetical protein